MIYLNIYIVNNNFSIFIMKALIIHQHCLKTETRRKN